jgi:hypothetical protein
LGSAESNPGEPVGALRPGQILQVNVDGPAPAWTAMLDSLDRRLAAGGLHAVTLPSLVGSGGD